MIWPGGIAAYIDSLSQGLRNLGATVKLLAVVRPDEKERIDFLEKHKMWAIAFQLYSDDKPADWLGRKSFSFLEILRCLSPRCRRILEGTSLFRSSRASIAKFSEILSCERPATIVFGNFDIRLYPLILFLIEHRSPYGIIAHGCEISRLPQNKPNDFVIRKMMLKGASWIAANSGHTKLLLDSWGIPSDKIKIIHPPISEEVIRQSGIVEPGFKKNDALNLVTMCRLVRGKGIDLILRALKILTAREIPYQFFIGGDGPERGPLERLVQEFGLGKRVYFKGSLHGEEKWRLLRSADVYVMPSRFDPTIPWEESFGIAFVEAAAFGVPAVASRSGGIPDAVVDGKTGILVPEEAPVDLADALTFLYHNSEIRRELGEAARIRAISEFSPKVIASRFRESLPS